MRPSAVIPSATCFAVKLVVLPSSSATAVSDLNCCSVAPVTAFTIRISSSKSAKVFVEYTKGAAASVATVTRFFPTLVMELPKLRSLAWAALSPLSSLVWSSINSTNARPALTFPDAPLIPELLLFVVCTRCHAELIAELSLRVFYWYRD